MTNTPFAQRSLIFSVTADYALRATLVLARSPEKVWRADALADTIGAPRNYLSKTLNELTKAGILTSTRGPTGGFRLGVPPAELSVATIVNVFDERTPNARCLLHDRPCTPTEPCGAHDRWSTITRLAIEALDSTTVADLIGRADV